MDHNTVMSKKRREKQVQRSIQVKLNGKALAIVIVIAGEY